MVLISPEALQRLNTPVRDNTIDNLESDMTSVLHAPKLEDRTKWAQYAQLLQRRQHFLDQMRQPTELPIVETPTTKDYNQDLREEILQTLPKVYKTKGELLFNRLCACDLINWDNQGLVTINNKVLAGSNIIDLVCDVIRRKKSGAPAGWKEFLDGLRRINIPQEFIGNPLRRTDPNTRPVFPSLNARRRRTIVPSRPVARHASWGHVRLS